LRSNGGGSLSAVVDMLGHFIPDQTVTLVQDSNNKITDLTAPKKEVVYNKPLMVLVNGQSASASEIFSAAIQDYGKGVIAGEPTFGKGTVQNLIPFNNGSRLKITTAKFFRPTGLSVQELGVVPDIELMAHYPQKLFGEIAYDNHMPTSTITVPFTNNEKADWFTKLSNVDVDYSELTLLDNYFEIINNFYYQDSITLNIDKRKESFKTLQNDTLNIINEYRSNNGQASFENFDEYENYEGDIFQAVVKDSSIELLKKVL
jgi:carboxyl-terminal processing protease